MEGTASGSQGVPVLFVRTDCMKWCFWLFVVRFSAFDSSLLHLLRGVEVGAWYRRQGVKGHLQSG